MELVKPITSDHELLKLADKLNIKIDGILAIQEISKTLPKKGSYLILLRADNGVGHWVCVYDNEYFDSMGNPSPKLLGHLNYNPKQYQGTYSEYCGVWSLLWLYCKQRHKMNLLKGFSDLDIDVI